MPGCQGAGCSERKASRTERSPAALDRPGVVPHTDCMHLGSRRAAIAATTLGLLLWTLHGPAPARAGDSFAADVARLSEPGGTFDTDNLISNERSYLDVVPALVSRGVTGGAYLGVGPDQNFSYIAQIRPEIAFIVDIRRDNLLLHLLFKALFADAHSRVEYLSMLTGRAPPSDDTRWSGATLKSIVSCVDGKAHRRMRCARRVAGSTTTIKGFGVPLSRADFETIDRFHRAFIEAGLGLQFHSFNRAPQPLLSDASRSPARHR